MDKNITKDLEEEGYYREVMRRIQDLRKKNNLRKEEGINLDISFEVDIGNFKDEIKKRAGVKELSFKKKKYSTFLNGEIKGKKFELSFEKLKESFK